LSLQPNSYTENLHRERTARYPNIEQALALWIDQTTSANYTLSGYTIIEKAKTFAKAFDILNFKGSNGWFEKFKKRYNVREYIHCGETNSAPLENLPQYRNDLQDLISAWNLDDVYNCDETGLYWKLEPSKTLSRRPISGTKKPKDCITVLLTCNATGTSKLTPLFIHKYKNSRCLQNIDKNNLPVYYYWNSSAWMQSTIFSHWLMKLNQDMRKLRRNILLLLDEEVSFSNITLHYLPPNTTAHLQPCDAGIIHSFKVSNFFNQFFFVHNFNLFLVKISTAFM